MGRKRKTERSEEDIRRKIKKLEDQLAKTVPKNMDLSVEENFHSFPLETPDPDTPYAEYSYCESPVPDTLRYDERSPRIPSPCPLSPGATAHVSPQATAPPALVPTSSPPPRPTSPPQPGTSTENQELDEEILQLLGDAPQVEAPHGPPLHKDVARRWQDVLAKGLPKEAKEKLLKEYCVPENCDLLTPAALNPEVKAALPEPLIKRDASLKFKQKQMAAVLSALSTVMNMVLSSETSKHKLLKPLSDACRILCDQHYCDTNTRRKFVISSINSKLRDALIESKRDKSLFGDNLSEKLKAAKTIQQSGDALKTAKPKPQRLNAASVNKGHLNYAPQHRKTENKSTDGRQTASYAHRQPTNSYTRRAGHPPRPLPPPHAPPARAPAPQRR